MADTDGVLDRCEECGAMAEIRRCSVLYSYVAQCTECANSSYECGDKTDAMTDWNKQQRKAREII